MLVSVGLRVPTNVICLTPLDVSRGPWKKNGALPSCAKTRPSRHRRKNCAYRNQAKTLAREQVTRRPPTLDCGSTIWTRRERKRSRFYLNIGVARVTAFRVPHTATTADR